MLATCNMHVIAMRSENENPNDRHKKNDVHFEWAGKSFCLIYCFAQAIFSLSMINYLDKNVRINQF